MEKGLLQHLTLVQCVNVNRYFPSLKRFNMNELGLCITKKVLTIYTKSLNTFKRKIKEKEI